MKIDTIKIDRALTVKHYFLSNGVVVQRHNTPSSVSLNLVDTNTNHCVASSAWCRSNSEAWRKLKRCPEFPRSRKG